MSIQSLNKSNHASVIVFVILLNLFFTSLAQAIWDSPYPNEPSDEKILYSSFSSPPKHLDPVVSYVSNEWMFISQIYEPPLQYHYLKRPYTLEPLTLAMMPEVLYLDSAGKRLPAEQQQEADFTEYRFRLKSDIRYQPHPAFVQQGDGYLYHQLNASQLQSIKTLADFPKTATRQLLAADYVYAIKRMALRQNHSPILDSMAQYIVGLKDFSEDVSHDYEEQLKQSNDTVKNQYFDLNNSQIQGVKVLSESEFLIRINGVYPQFLYWLTMNFFAPVPWEAVRFYKQQGLAEKNISLDTAPVGTGPYYLAENNPNQRIRLRKNPNFHQEFYPDNGLADGANPTLLADAGKPLPFIDEVVYSLEKESVPLWNKFLQGYYDGSGVSSSSFDQAVSITTSGDISLTQAMRDKDIQFLSSVLPTIFYFGFNMADPIVGGYDEKHRKLRQAISIAINYEEYISIFLNGRGIAAQGPLPPGIFGYDDKGFNPYVYERKDGKIQRQSIEQAKQLLTEAGYPNGRDSNGEPLKLYFDTAATGPDSQSLLNWYRKQFAKLGIELVIRATDYNRFQSKVRGAKVQMFTWGWNADYPDPENFLFLLFGGNAAINTNGSGINSANYDNPEYNRLFTQMKTLNNGEERLQLVREMIAMAQKDAPWAWGFNPKDLTLYHSWLHNVWPNAMANNTLKYRDLDNELRQQQREEWNQPILWPFALFILLVIVSAFPLLRAYRRRQTETINATAFGKSQGGKS